MCLVLLAYQHHPKYPLILLSNRDEFYARSTAPAGFWTENPDILAGRDLESQGTWLGITKTGRFAVITNYRDPSSIKENAKSRGELIRDFLSSNDGPRGYLEQVKPVRELYNGFNLLIGDTDSCWYYSKVTNLVEEISSGIHGLSNHLLNTPWPKVVKGKKALESCLQNQNDIETERIFELLADCERASIKELPDTGVSAEREHLLSSIFIKSPDYGTRASTILTIDYDNHLCFRERTFNPGQNTWAEVAYKFDIIQT